VPSTTATSCAVRHSARATSLTNHPGRRIFLFIGPLSAEDRNRALARLASTRLARPAFPADENPAEISTGNPLAGRVQETTGPSAHSLTGMEQRKAGRYELQEEIGRGAMGVVYKAIDPLIGRTVAIKTMRLEDMGGTTPKPELLNRFHIETRAAGLLSHPNIVVIYDAGADGDLFYITMEYVAGRSLQAMMDEKQAFPLPRLLRLMEQACRALDYAHQRNIVHRDVKPANILLGELDTVKITDFGTAKILERGGTQTGHIIGTPSYMSPEQVKGRPVDGRADVFSLGVILYELVTGEKPFPGKNVTTVIYKIVHEDPIPPIVLDTSLHPGLNAVINKVLAKEPDDRYQSCGELLKALRNYREGPLSQAPTVMMRAPVLPISASPDATMETPPAARPATQIGTRSPQTAPAPGTATPAVPAPPSQSRTYFDPPPPEKKRGGLVWALFLLAVMGVAGYFAWPALHDLLQRSGVPMTQGAPQGGTQPKPLPDTTTNPANPGTTTPEEPPPPAESSSKSAKGKPAEKVPAKSAPAKEESSSTAGNFAAAKTKLEQRISDESMSDRIRVGVSGNLLTLTGSLTKADHRRLMQRMPAMPAKVRVVDKIQIVKAAAGEMEEKPKTAPGRGEVEVVTDVLGANAVLTGPKGAAVANCRTPCRFEDLEPGRYTMEVNLDGYRQIKRIIEVRAGHISGERLTMQAPFSSLIVESRPPGAEVLINGQRQSQATPATIPLSPGNYAIVVQKTGYERYAGTVELKSDSMKRLEVELIEHRGSTGSIEVRSIPRGADILVNNNSTGRRTPARIELPAGQYTVTLYLKGYAPLEKIVVVQENRAVQMNETLTHP
jgi:serine/threonine protein kinase